MLHITLLTFVEVLCISINSWVLNIHRYLFSTLKEPSVNRKYLQALTLVGPTRGNMVLNPLAVIHLDNRQYLQRGLCRCGSNGKYFLSLVASWVGWIIPSQPSFPHPPTNSAIRQQWLQSHSFINSYFCDLSDISCSLKKHLPAF